MTKTKKEKKPSNTKESVADGAFGIWKIKETGIEYTNRLRKEWHHRNIKEK